MKLELFPDSIRARAGLAMLYRAQGACDESNARNRGDAPAIADAAGCALAEKLWTMFGETGAGGGGPGPRRARRRPGREPAARTAPSRTT